MRATAVGMARPQVFAGQIHDPTCINSYFTGGDVASMVGCGSWRDYMTTQLSFISCFSLSLTLPITTISGESKIHLNLTLQRNNRLKGYNNISYLQIFTSIDFNPQAPYFHLLSWQEIGMPEEVAWGGYGIFCIFVIQVLSI